MSIELDKDKLLEHLETEWSKRWNARVLRPRELCHQFLDKDLAPENVRKMREIYFRAYMDGVNDLLAAVLEFDGDIRGTEAVAALLIKTQSSVES